MPLAQALLEPRSPSRTGRQTVSARIRGFVLGCLAPHRQQSLQTVRLSRMSANWHFDIYMHEKKA